MSFSNRMSAALYPPIGAEPTTVPDRAGGNDGTNNGAKVALVDGVTGLEFDSSQEQFVRAQIEGVLTGYPIMMEAEAILSRVTGAAQAIFTINPQGPFDQYLGFAVADGQIRFLNRSSSNNAPDDLGSVSQGDRVFISAAYYSEDDRDYFIDGIQVGSADSPVAFPDLSDMQALIGTLRFGGTTFFLDSVCRQARLWDISGRTKSQVEQQINDNLFDIMQGNEPGLVGYWPMKYGAHQ